MHFFLMLHFYNKKLYFRVSIFFQSLVWTIIDYWIIKLCIIVISFIFGNKILLLMKILYSSRTKGKQCFFLHIDCTETFIIDQPNLAKKILYVWDGKEKLENHYICSHMYICVFFALLTCIKSLENGFLFIWG